MDFLEDFINLTKEQKQKFSGYGQLLQSWNQKINLISRKDIHLFFERHLIPALSLLKILSFAPGSRILDVGSGSGIPGLALAIAQPQAHFTLLDSIQKKTRVLATIVQELQLQNIEIINNRVENFNSKFDFVLGRAVCAFEVFISLTRKNIRPGQKSSFANGIFYLTGGPINSALQPQLKIFSLSTLGTSIKDKYWAYKKRVP